MILCLARNAGPGIISGQEKAKWLCIWKSHWRGLFFYCELCSLYNTIQYNREFALKNWQTNCQYNL